MSNEKPVANDLLGVAPYGEAIKIAVEKAAETAQTFLYAICKPAADEFGLLLRDRVRVWRVRNLAGVVNKAKELVPPNTDGVQLQAHPRIVAEIVENGSWCEDEELQRMWAGLLASACNEDGTDESNLLFSDVLKRLTSPEARLVSHVCCWWGRERWKAAYGLSLDEIATVTGLHKTVVEYHLGHLDSLGLLDGSHTVRRKGEDKSVPSVRPKRLALHLFVRCKGWRGSPEEYFDRHGKGVSGAFSR